MLNKILMVIVINIVYLIICNIIIRIRNSKDRTVRQWDNGYEFYESLSETKKERYWNEDTKIVKCILVMFLFILEGSLLLYIICSNDMYWIGFLIFGIVVSSVVAIVLSLKLQKRFR